MGPQSVVTRDVFFSYTCLFGAVLGLHCCVRLSPVSGGRGCSPGVGGRLCGIVTSPVMLRLQGLQASWVFAHRPSCPAAMRDLCSQTRDRKHVLCIDRWDFNHRTISEILETFVFYNSLSILLLVFPQSESCLFNLVLKKKNKKTKKQKNPTFSTRLPYSKM